MSNQDVFLGPFHSVGNADWIESVVIPLSDNLRQDIPLYIGEIPPAMRQRMTRSAEPHVLNSFSMQAAMVGVSYYVAKKFGDEFWDAICKQRVRKVFEGIDKLLSGGNQKAEKTFLVNSWHQEFGVVLCVAVIGKDFAHILAQLDQVGTVQRNAMEWIAQNGVIAPVHCYKIEGGQVNTKPIGLERVDQAFGLSGV